MDNIALTQDKDKIFRITYKDGKLVRERSEISFAKHNLFCFGRLDRNLTINPTLRRGFAGSVMENREMYSTAWNSYREGSVTTDTENRIISIFNQACDRDLKFGLFELPIRLISIQRLDKTSLLFNISP